MTRTRTTRRNHHHVVRRNLDTVMHSSSVSPYVGFIRHAPPSSRTYNSTSRTSSRKKFIADSAALWEEYLKKYNCSGHLLGGNSLEVACPRNRLNSSSSYSLFHWFGNSPSAGLFQSEYVKDIINPLDYLDMLNKLAYWFIFPIANDATYTFRETNERDYFREVASVVVPFFSSLFRQVLQIDFSHSVGTTFEESVDAEELSREVSSHSQQDSMVSLSTTSYRQLEKDLVENDQEVTTSSYSQENKLFRSISSIDSDEIMSESQGYLDIETILKLPVITYGEDNSNDGIDYLDASECDTSSDAKSYDKVNVEGGTKGLEWSWIAVPKDVSDATESLDSLPVSNRSSVCKDDSCAICLESFQKGDRLRVLPCNHRFHCGCIDKWLSGSISYACPTCKNVPTVDDDSFPLQSIESMISMGSMVELCDDDSMQSLNLDGTVPSWAFARLGSKIAD